MRDSVKSKKAVLPKKTNRRLPVTVVRVVLGLLFLGAFAGILLINPLPAVKIDLKEGGIADKAIYADRDFRYEDKQKLELLCREVRARVREVYNVDESAREEVDARLDEFFKKLKEGFSHPEIELKPEELNIKISVLGLKTLLADKHLEEARDIVREIVGDLMSGGLLSELEQERLVEAETYSVTVRTPNTEKEKHRLVSDLLTINKARRAGFERINSLFPRDRRMGMALKELLENSLAANLHYDAAETEQRRAAAAGIVPAQYREVKKGEPVIRKGERVSREHLDRLMAMRRQWKKATQFSYLFGFTVLTISLFLSFYFYLRRFHRWPLLMGKNLVLSGLLLLLVLLAAKLIIYFELPSYLVPVSFAAMLLTILLNPPSALMVTIMLSILAGVVMDFKLEIMIVSLFGSLVGIYLVQDIRRRSHLLKAGLLIGLANLILIIGIGFLKNVNFKVYLLDGFWGGASGIISSFMVMGSLPVFEQLFNIVTGISLLEISDLNHPLLKKLLIQVPGTYHHSLVVGNLSETAGRAIGANSLLLRAGSYYHDIGKMKKSKYFSENWTDTKDKHSKLAPSMSSLIILNHIKEGVEIARQNRLNPVIIDFIREHHGTSLMYFFYQQAVNSVKKKNATEKEKKVMEQSFRYPGPKPQTKETAILMLADSVEAAARALNQPTPSRIKGLVQKVIEDKFIDGQLDECDLTLRDLNKIRSSFVHVLTGIHHMRVAYPEKSQVTPHESLRLSTGQASHTLTGTGKSYPYGHR